MAVSNGPWQNHRRIEWDYSGLSSSQGQTHVQPVVYAYLRAESGWDEESNGSKSWSGHWGSGSAAQYWSFSRNGERVLIVNGGGLPVAMGDAASSVSFVVTANHWFGSTGSTLVVGIPARFAITPTDLTVTRVSDNQQTLGWTRKSEYTGVVVHRSTDGGPWQEIGRPTGNVATFTDTTTEANRKYEYRVAGLNSRASGGIGQSAWSTTVTIFTSPAAPASASADRDGTDILVTAAGLPPHATSFDIEDAGSIVKTGAVLPWRHAAPSPTIPHTYRVRGVVGGVAGAWSPPSNTVQLITRPNPPVNLTPNGGVAASDGPVRLEFTHNPVDTSAQTAYELRHRVPAGAWTTLSGTTASFRDVTLPVGEREWQVRTKGAHVDWSDWSAIATVTVINRPGVAITQPGPTWDASILTGKWSYLQAQGRPQSGWEVELLDGTGTVVEARSGSGATAEVVFSTRLAEGSWSLRARAATGAVWSAWALSAFTVLFSPPPTPVLSGAWDEVAGGVGLALDSGDPVAPLEPITNLFTNPRFMSLGASGTIPRGGALADDDPDVTIDGTNVRFNQASDASRVGADVAVVSSVMWASSGTRSIRIVSRSTAYDTFASPGGDTGAFRLGMQPGKTYTALVKARLAEPMTNASGTIARTIRAFYREAGGAYNAFNSTPAPNTVGVHEIRLTFTVPATATEAFVRLYSGAQLGGGEIWFDDFTLVEGVYSGPTFHAGQRIVVIDGTEYEVLWAGAEDASVSVAGPMPETVSLQLERSVDSGLTWEHMLALDAPEAMTLMDWESLSYGNTMYRLTAYTVEGATSETVLPVVATSHAVWLSGGIGFVLSARLPFNPAVRITAGRSRALKRYAGRALPVAYSGEALMRTVSVSGTTTDHALSGEESANVERLTQLAQAGAPVFMFRDPDGRRIYGAIGDIQMSREMVTPHPGAWNALWSYSFTLEESGRS